MDAKCWNYTKIKERDMKITDIKIRKFFDEGPMKAVVSVTLNDCLAVHDIKVIYARERYFIVMPSNNCCNAVEKKGRRGIFRYRSSNKRWIQSSTWRSCHRRLPRSTRKRGVWQSRGRRHRGYLNHRRKGSHRASFFFLCKDFTFLDEGIFENLCKVFRFPYNKISIFEKLICQTLASRETSNKHEAFAPA